MLRWHHDDQPERPGRRSSPTSIRLGEQPGSVIAAGALDLGFRHRVKAVLDAALADRPAEIRLDLSSVWLIDASTVGVLAECLQQAADAGGQLVIVGASGMVRTVLEITGISMCAEPVDEPTPNSAGARKME